MIARRNVLLILLFPLAFLIGGLIFIVSQLERTEVVVPVGFQGEARRNSLLAAERMFTALGVPARSHPVLVDVPPPDHTLVLYSVGRSLGVARSSALLEWVEGGGQLVVLVPNPRAVDVLGGEEFWAGQDSELLRVLGVRVIRTGDVGARRRSSRDRAARFFEGMDDSERRVGEDSSAEGRESGPGLHSLRVGGRDLTLSLPRPYGLVDERGTATRTWGSPERVVALRFVRGDGIITVVCDGEWISNSEIDEHDHAALAWEIVRAGGDPRGIWIVFDDRMPGIFTALWSNAPEAVLSFLAVILLWLWYRAARFGPRIPDPLPQRREFVDHVEAAGRFLWSCGASGALLRVSREELLERLRARPSNDHAGGEKDDASKVLAGASGLPEARVRDALSANQITDAQHFTRVVRDLETMRRAL